MGLIRIVIVLAVVAGLVWLFWPLLRRLGAWMDSGVQPEPAERGPKLIVFERDPFEVLGLSEGASRFEVERAWRHIMQENAPEKVQDLSPELQAAAARLREDATRARDDIVAGEGDEA